MSCLARNSADYLKILAYPGLGARHGNPYTWLLYSNMPCQVDDFNVRRACFGRYTILHLHWPESDLNGSSTAVAAYLRLSRRFFAIDCMRARGTKVFWTVHNLGAHERRHPLLERWFWRELLGRLDGYIALTEGGRAEAMKRFPLLHNLPGFVVPHGHYRGEYPEAPAVDSRAALGLARDAKIVLFFGQIRPYKNVSLLIDVFRRCCDPDNVLYIAGRPNDSAQGDQLCARAAGDSRIRIETAYIPPERVHLYFKSADLVVLPYRDILNSGVALLALSFNRPILVPNQGAMRELFVQVGAEWVRTFDDLTAGELCAALEWARGLPRFAVAPLNHLDWSVLAMRTLDAYERVLSHDPSLRTAEIS